ncbi:MAG: hypothetical protein CMI60_02855 [Parvibaculum sp.]|jgi:hypothetical protein|nr:hypothetical protein [Parvibaculum sp.]
MSSQDVRSRVEKFARIADAAYYNQNRRGLRRILEGDAQTRGFRVDELLTSDESLVLYNPQTREVVISFRGTVPSAKDLATDLAIGLGMHTSTQRYRQSVELTRIVQQKYGAMGYDPVEVAGHSLGGGIAAFVANQDGSITAHVYNGAISLRELFDDQWDDDDTAGIIYSNSTSSDPVSAIQGIAATHGSAVVNNRIRQIWLPASNGNGVIQAHTIEGNFYKADSRADYWHPYRYDSSHMRKPRGTHKPPVIKEVKRVASNKETRAKVKKEFERGRDIVQTIAEEGAEEVPYAMAVSRVAAVQKIAKGLPDLVQIARKPESQTDTREYDNKVAELMTDAVYVSLKTGDMPVMPATIYKGLFNEKAASDNIGYNDPGVVGIRQVLNATMPLNRTQRNLNINQYDAHLGHHENTPAGFQLAFEGGHNVITVPQKDSIVRQQPNSLQVPNSSLPAPNLLRGSGPMN